MLELWFLFCSIWSLGAGVNEDGRKKMDNYIRELEGQFPPKDTVYEYYVDTKTKNWALWEEKLKGSWRYPTKYANYIHSCDSKSGWWAFFVDMGLFLNKYSACTLRIQVDF